MGYTTEFIGHFTVKPTLKPEHAAYLHRFSETRRMKRNPSMIALPDPVREAAGLPLGKDGAYFVGATDFRGQSRTDDIVDYNEPPSGQPGLWCEWIPTDDNEGIEWNGSEKFYHYSEWLIYIIDHFLKPWGYRLDGRVRWAGENPGDIGHLIVSDSVVMSVIPEYKEAE